MKTRSHILVFTGSRADFGRLLPVSQALAGAGLDVGWVAGGAHLDERFGRTIDEVRGSGLPVAAEIDMRTASDRGLDLANALAAGLREMARVLEDARPDLVLVLGDRTELLSVVSACLCQSVPLAHVGGGQHTQGAVDNQIRHLTTKAAHLHFVANEPFRGEVIAMGEEPWRVFATGSPSIDALMHVTPLTREMLSQDLGLDLSQPTILVTYHPTTLERARRERDNDEFFKALEALDEQLVLTYPNADEGSEDIIRRLKALAGRRPRCALVASLGGARYASLLRYVDLMVGNSSSGIIEAPVFDLPVVNVGSRQEGRLKAGNVIETPVDHAAIARAAAAARARGKVPCGKPYGDGRAAPRIARILGEQLQTRAREALLKKQNPRQTPPA